MTLQCIIKSAFDQSVKLHNIKHLSSYGLHESKILFIPLSAHVFLCSPGNFTLGSAATLDNNNKVSEQYVFDIACLRIMNCEVY